MTDLIERLQDLAKRTQGNLTVPAMIEAADALEAQEREVAELRAKLDKIERPF